MIKRKAKPVNNIDKHISDIIDNTKYQRFNPYSMFDFILSTYAKYNRINIIATDKGCRSKRKRDYDKKVFSKAYTLLGHSDGKFRQKWFVGSSYRLEWNKKSARIRGPKDFYVSSKIERLACYVTSAMCKLLISHYRHELSFRDLLTRLNRMIFAINKRIGLDLDSQFYNYLQNQLKEFLKIGWRNHLTGGSFGRNSGRPSNKSTEANKRPRLFVDLIKSKEGQELINIHLKAQGKWDREKKSATIKGLVTYYASSAYTKNTILLDTLSGIEVLKHCLSNSHEQTMLITSTNNVQNSFKSKINTDHYTYYVSNHSNKTSSSSRPYNRSLRVRLPQPPNFSDKNYLQCTEYGVYSCT